ncbi:replication restart helicase PriA [Sphingobacterium psychroaquaticum]|uniref:Replication restart protein PriA n=1 Tax=Sphingobacterium psychroaquaticum TaxID=561061 RepID=A0A1X7J1W6_9SPHI|nr:primosomal protein N' [Sphingobacterium psychroaquaticum]SMG21526.1 replication restart DNA helicase PriA [Sphingobacterium psychroaquaticum]
MVASSLFSAGQETYFVEVILPLYIAKTYTYRVPVEWNDHVAVGKRVIVQFGRNKIYAAVVHKVSHEAPLGYEAKYILNVIDDQPILDPTQLTLWEWMADYYLCYLGEIMQAALPAAMKMASETKIVAAENEDLDRSLLTDKGYMIMEALDVAGELTINDVVKLLGQKTVFPLLKTLFDEGYLLISEEIKDRYKPKVKTFLSLDSQFSDAEGKRILLDSLNKAPKQQDAVLALLQLQKTKEDITRQDIMEAAGISAGVVASLIEKGVFVLQEKIVSRLGGEDLEITADFTLNERQEAALASIEADFQAKDVVLLHGVTASGKTQLYIRLIESAIASGKKVLYLLPEIALTAQITERLRLHFGDKLGVYHSKFNDNERAEVWRKVLNGEYEVVIGARSSVFLPFQELGLIIVDEEHESSYKQYEPAPRYHARDTAIYLAGIHKAKVLLGSATPSIESYYNAKAGKYGLVEMKERYGASQLPIIELVDVAEAGRKGQMFNYFSGTLLQGITDALGRKEQVILFQNRRGHTPFVQCNTCGWVAKCVNCDVSLTYHKSTNHLHCHYCGHHEPPIQICPGCGMAHIESKGFGTERIEEELELLLPEARIGRLDMDSAKGKHGFDKIITSFDDHEFDILIGTQMVAKGLDFGRVSLIGIISADAMINFPDFRAYERAFSLFSQVAGRAGRRDQQGKVIIQTHTPNHRVLEQVLHNDYEGMFMTEVKERKNYQYPPFYRIIKLDVKHTDLQLTHDAAVRLASLLRGSLGARVLGPEPPLISRVRNYFIQTITLKIERGQVSIVKVKELIRQAITHFEIDKQNRSVRISIDVDPY